MSGDDARERWLARIRHNIDAYGHHVTLVQGGASPRFAYTIGHTEHGRPELVLAGAAALDADAVTAALNGDDAGFTRRPVHGSWRERLLLGAVDLYGDRVTAEQLVPPEALRTIDVPDLSAPFGADPVWRWLDAPWPHATAPDAVAVTDLDALGGAPVLEAARWEEDEWELFSGPGPDVPPDAIRVVPLATLLGHDPSLEAVVALDVGRALRRDPGGAWEAWGSG